VGSFISEATLRIPIKFDIGVFILNPSEDFNFSLYQSTVSLVILEVFKAMMVCIIFSWAVTPCSLVNGYMSFGRNLLPQLQPSNCRAHVLLQRCYLPTSSPSATWHKTIFWTVFILPEKQIEIRRYSQNRQIEQIICTIGDWHIGDCE
jgi:hypothetical protein